MCFKKYYYVGSLDHEEKTILSCSTSLKRVECGGSGDRRVVIVKHKSLTIILLIAPVTFNVLDNKLDIMKIQFWFV